MFATLQNTDADRAKFLRPLGDLSNFIQRYTSSVGGQQCQDITDYNRHCQLYDCLRSKSVRDMDDIESSANPRWDGDYHDYAILCHWLRQLNLAIFLSYLSIFLSFYLQA